MIEPPSLTVEELTGKYRFKKNFWGSMVLWVQERLTHYPNQFDEDLKNETTYWRKADEFDIPIMRAFLKKNLSKKKLIKIEDIHIGFKYEELIPNPERYISRQEKIWVERVYSITSPRLSKMKKLIEKDLVRLPR